MSSRAVQPSMRDGGNTEKAARALHALLDLSKALSSTVDIDDLLTVIVEKSSAVVEAERTSVFIYDPERDRLWSRIAQGVKNVTIELAMGSGIVGDVAKTRTAVNIADAYEDPRFNPETDRKTGFRTRAILCAPVVDKGKLLGVVESINKIDGGTFDEQDESLMNALAAHAAVAIDRAQATEIQLENERFEQSLRVANEIQMRMLPNGKVQLPETAPFAIHAHIRPAKQVGGDLYDFFWNDDRLHFCIGDVTGKGIGAALVMAMTKTLFRAHASFQNDPASLMSAVSARLYEETDPAMFVTAFCGFLDLRTGTLRYSNAGHDRPLILAPGKASRPLESKSGLPLGVLAQFKYVQEEITLQPGEALFLYTDGVTEATNRGEELFSMERLRDVLEKRDSETPSRLVPAVLETVDHFAEHTPQADDITMLCIQYRGAAASFKRNVAELERVFALLAQVVDDRSIDFAVEEIFVNCIEHNPDGQGDIAIRVARHDDEVTVSIADPDAARYDINIEPDTRTTLEQRVPGGLGLFLTKKMMDRVDYVHENGVGTVTLSKRVG